MGRFSTLPSAAAAAAAVVLLALLAGGAAAFDHPAMRRAVVVARREAAQALADPAAAFEAYTASFAPGGARRSNANSPLPFTPGGLGDPLSRAERLAVFTANLHEADRLNEANPHAAFGVTPFTGLTLEEFKKIMTVPANTLVRPRAAPKDGGDAGVGGRRRLLGSCGGGTFSSSLTPPAAIDHVALGRVGPIRNQGQCGSCAAFAATAVHEAHLIAKGLATNTTVNLSEQDLMSCTSGDQCKGYYTDRYMDRIACNGQANEAAAPYKAVDNQACKTVTRPRAIKQWQFVPTDTTNLARAVSLAPTAIAVAAGNPAWRGYKGGYLTSCAAQTSQTVIDHAVVAVGYDDNTVVNATTGLTASMWKIRNSWGTGWGSQGYIYLAKGCTGKGPFLMFFQNPIAAVRA